MLLRPAELSSSLAESVSRCRSQAACRYIADALHTNTVVVDNSAGAIVSSTPSRPLARSRRKIIDARHNQLTTLQAWLLSSSIEGELLGNLSFGAMGSDGPRSAGGHVSDANAQVRITARASSD